VSSDVHPSDETIDVVGQELLAAALGLRSSDLQPLAGELRLIDLDPGDVLVSQGDVAADIYVLLQGQLEVTIDSGATHQVLTTLAPGAIVGEIAIFGGDARSATVTATADARVICLSELGFRQILLTHPAAAESLARRAAERLRETQLVAQINQLFGVLDPGALDTVKGLIDWVPVRAGTRLFAEGEEGDAGYFVVTGRLRAFRSVRGGAEVEVGEIGRGEMAGEMALLEHAPRSATVYAVRDSQLVRFSRAAFETLLVRYPSAALLVALTVLRRSQHGQAHPQHRRLSIVVVPGSGDVDGALFARELVESLGPGACLVSSSSVDHDLGLPGISQVRDDEVGATRLGYWLEELQERHRFLVYSLDSDWTAWSRRALRWADHVLVVADAKGSPDPLPFEQELWRLVELQKHPKVSLALLHEPDTVLPSGTRRWLDQRDVASHHHVKRADPATLGRLSRILAGEGTSLVLGGGGARGFAHLGALVVLEEEGLPIDMIGGTSIGSIMAVGPAMGLAAEEFRQICIEQFQSIFDYTLPSVSLMKGERISHKIRNLLGDADITDLWVPYYCVATSLTAACARYQDRGPVVDAIRASIAIPGVLPPVASDGELLVDGGILDNVPVDEMRRRNPTGRIIAIDVAPAEGPTPQHDYGLSISGFRAALDRRRGKPAPGLLSTVMRSSLIASARDRDRVVRERIADLYLDVTVDGGGLLDFSEAAHIAASAESTTRPILRRWVNGAGGEDTRYVQTPPAGGKVLDGAQRRRRGVGVLLLTMRDLQHRAVRFAAVIAGTAVVLALLFLMTGLVEQFHREPVQTVEALGADQWLLREGASGAFTSASTMPEETADLVEGVEAAPIVVARQTFADDGEDIDIVVIGYEPGALGEPTPSSGSLPGAGEVLIDDSAGLDAGDEIVLGGRQLSVTGTTDNTTMFAGMPLVFMPIDQAQELVYRGQPLATTVLLAGPPDAVPEGFAVLTGDEVAQDGMRPLDGAISSIQIIRFLLWFVAAMIIGTMIYLSALERRRDVAVLKAVGGSTGQMAASIALQGVLIALASTLIAAALQAVLVPVFPMQVAVPDSAFVQVPVIAVLVALASGGVGLRKAVQTDPALAFSGPGA